MLREYKITKLPAFEFEATKDQVACFSELYLASRKSRNLVLPRLENPVQLINKIFVGATAQKWSFLPEQDVGLDIPESRPLIVAHRGASGMFPEHTSIAYEQAAEQVSPLNMSLNLNL